MLENEKKYPIHCPTPLVKVADTETMYCLSCVSITKPLALASLPTNDSPPPPPIQTNPTKPLMHTTKPTTSLPKKKQQQNKRQSPSIAEIERAIGAGRYRDIDASELKEEEVANFDFMSMSFTGKFEGPVEKKLRETGEWLVTSTESKFRASGKKIFMFIFQWMLPIWTLSLLMASGVVKLPFSTPFLDDLLM
ncbi:hypothetical protein FH972_014982 [Carpinus fangiana]|uniref:NAD(P)H dehydrogenase subunit CRR3, chloroplastic n=1 Tax=Carpinus fangiana TaxID=176857 RepID=A0A5N6REZ3_9ROSI|nr:hypothetical protein FH972_014982 [Carpinus fangiana]